MPPLGRPPKRPGDGESPDDDSSPGGASLASAKVKLARLDRGPEDFSSVVKSKLQSYTRTGQACDRCKVRKIRCDALPEGCSHCINQNLECYVTDRVTGRTERRGYMQQLEREKSGMLAHIRQLEELLGNSGVDVKPWEWSPFGPVGPPGVSFDDMGNAMTDASSKDDWTQVGSVWVKNYQPEKNGGNRHGGHAASSSSVYSPPYLLESRPADTHLGVMTDSASLSSIKGTQLSILGATIDITSFDAPDMDEPPPSIQALQPLYNKSVQAFLQSTSKINPPVNAPLPSRDDAFTYSEWFFLTVWPFVPVLHKPSYMKLLASIYDDPSFEPTTAELVIVHIVFAIIYFQYGVRNRQDSAKQTQLNELSNKHYHWCLNRFFDLATDPSLTAVQALALVCTHSRAFPKPGCGQLIVTYTLNKAVDMGLHRKWKKTGEPTNLENELRKRTWWSIVGLTVTLNGRLGKPMVITLEEFDTDFPIAIDDEFLTEAGITDPSRIGDCAWIVAIFVWTIVPLYMEMYHKIYSVRRNPKKYVATVRALEEKLREWQHALPDDLKIESCKPGNQVFALYTQGFAHEFRLCLRHPSVCMTADPDFCAENSRVCEEEANKLLKIVDNLRALRSLDTTWYQLSVYVAAIFTTLVAHWERRHRITAAEMTKLKSDMDIWLAILAEGGYYMGAGYRVCNEVKGFIDRTISWIEPDLNVASSSSSSTHSRAGQAKTNASGVAQPASSGVVKQEFSHTHLPQPPPRPSNARAPAAKENISSNSSAANMNRGGGFYDMSQGIATAGTASYPQMAAYPEQSAVNPADSGHIGYDPDDTSHYLFTATAAATMAQQGGVAHQQSTTAQNPLVAFASQATQHVSSDDGWRTQQVMASGGNPWNVWTAAIADSQDRYSANALLTLGGTPHRGLGPGGHPDTSATDLNAGVSLGQGDPHPSQWPLLVFHDGNGAVSGG